MRRRRILWHLYPYYLLVIVLSLVAVSWYASRSIKEFYIDRTTSELEARARLFENQIAGYFEGEDERKLDSICSELGNISGTRITVIAPSGVVLCDSQQDPASMENHGDRPEIIEALAGITGKSVRYSGTLRQNFVYVAVPVRKGGEIVGAVRASLPLAFIEEDLRGMYIRIVIGGIIVAVIGGLVSFAVSRRISRPLEDMKRGIARFANDELSYRLPVHDLEEIGDLAEVMNEMAARLEDRIETVTRQRNEQEAVFSSMVEGLLAVDMEERVIKVNRAASMFLGVDSEAVCGRTIQEAVRNPDLQGFVAKALSAVEPVEGDIVLRGGSGERFLQAHGTQLYNPGGDRRGAVIVLNDVTRLRRLENVRRDFVANVSHELKTPITSIKGFVETLQDGAINVPRDTEHFLGIIAKQADRMDSIIEDLLLISRVEQEVEKEKIRFEDGRIKSVLQGAIQVVESKGNDKDVTIELDCPDTLSARMNPALLEQAVINLVDNAIKYSEPGERVTVAAQENADGIVINVIDRGCGIENEHLPRLFERFYRVDRARSRKLGGTGLGLAIVKHIVQAHRGSVTVESAPNEGSVFSIHLPKTV